MNSNRLIDLKFKTKTHVFELQTPRHGVKPNIEISGSLSGQSFCQNFEIRITNLYCDEIDNTTTVEVWAGYEGNMTAGLQGQVTNVYTATPAPDKITVISCTSALYSNWLTKTIDLRLEKGWKLVDALKQISNALGYTEPFIDDTLKNIFAPQALYRNGLCSQAIQDIQQCFGSIMNIIPRGNKIYAVKKNRAPKEGTTTENILRHKLLVLTQPPQFTGGAVSLIAPFNPAINCGDIVIFPTQFRDISNEATQIVFDEAIVNTIDFSFSTVGNTNEMTIGATAMTIGGANA